MEYKSIEDLNICDAVRRLEEALRMKDPERIGIARAHLKNQLDLVKTTKLSLYQKHLDLLE